MKNKLLLFLIILIGITCFYGVSFGSTAKAEETNTGNGTGNTTAALSSISIKQFPSKLTYEKGESLDLSDLILEGYYMDGTSQIITEYEIFGYDSNRLGYQNVFVSYQGVSAIFNVTVIQAKVKNITSINHNTNFVTLTWDAVPGATYYEIYSLDTMSGNYIMSSLAYTNSITLYFLPATMQSIRICAVEMVGGFDYRGGYSDTFVAATAPEVVTGLYVTGTTASSVSLSWNPVPGATGYIIYRATSSGTNFSACATTNSSTYLDKSLSSGKGYQYKVGAYTYSKDYYGAASFLVDISTNPAKMVSKYKAGEQKIRITWNKVTGASYYDIYIGDAVTGYTILTSQKASDPCSYLIEGLTTGNTYSFYTKVRRNYKNVVYESQASDLTAVELVDLPATNTEPKIFATKADFLKSMSYTQINFFKKYVQYSKSFIIPGLVSTNVGGFISTTMCPQGITFAGNYLLQTAYDISGEENSVIYVVDKNSRKLITTLILPSKTHVGGITYDGTNIWIPTGKKVSSIPISQIEVAVLAGMPYSYISYTTTYTLDITVSYLSYARDMLWAGTYSELEKTKMYSYTIENKDTTPILTKANTIVMPTRVQGVAFNSKGTLILSRSCQLYQGLRGYIRQLDLYNPDFANAINGVISLGDVVNIVEMPSMNEGIAIDGTYLYVSFESAAFKNASYKMDRICAFKLTSLTKKVT